MSITLILIILLAFYLAANLGANDVANAMATSVGSQAITLKQAIIMAAILEFTGAVLFGHRVSQTLATKIIDPHLFAATPEMYITGMVTVLIVCGVWLQIATIQGLPVSSSHAVLGAIAGFAGVALGVNAINWSHIILVTSGLILTPVLSGVIAAIFYSQIRHWILDLSSVAQLKPVILWFNIMIVTLTGAIFLPYITQPITNYLNNYTGLDLPNYDIPILIGVIASIVLTISSWQYLPSPIEGVQNNDQIPEIVKGLFTRFQVLSACLVAFAHGSNDVGNAIAPLAVIIHIHNTGQIPLNDIIIPSWIFILGGVGLVTGLSLGGYQVINTVGKNIITLEPSSGFCAEIATAIVTLLASRLGLPVSTSHALVGGIVGIGILQNVHSIQFITIKKIMATWLITIPVSAVLSAAIFSSTKFIFSHLI